MITFTGAGPTFVMIRGEEPPIEFHLGPDADGRHLAECRVPEGAHISIEGGPEAMAGLLPAFHPDDGTAQELYADPVSFYGDRPDESCAEEPFVTINGDDWGWMVAHDEDDTEFWALVPASSTWRATFRWEIGPDGDSGHYAVIHDPRASIVWEGDSASSTYSVVYGRDLLAVIREMIDVDHDWIAEDFAPWCPFCDVEDFWADDIMLPEVFEMTFAPEVDDQVVTALMDTYWKPCGEHETNTKSAADRLWQFRGGSWVATGNATYGT